MALTVASATAPTLIKNRADYVCDGTGDETEINAAITALPSTGGKIICVGDFSITSPILINKYGITLEGVGLSNTTDGSQNTIGTRFKATSAISGQVIKVQETANDRPCYGIILRDFSIEGGYFGSATDGILFRANRSLIDNVHVAKMTGWGIHVRGYTAAERDGITKWDTYDTSIRSVQIAACLNTGNPATATGGGGLWFDLNAPDCHVVNCVIYDNYDNCRVSVASEQITSNHFYDAVHYNVWFDSSGSRTKFVGNKVEGAGSHGLMVDNTTAGTSALQIVGNNFKNNGDAADNSADHINITGSSSFGHTAMLIVGNSFTKDSATANRPRNAINMSSANQGTLIVGNSFGADSHFGSTRINGTGSGGNPVVIGQNSGFVARNGGSLTISDGGTITHGLGDSFAGRAPSRLSVVSMTAGVIATVSNYGATTITVNLRLHDGTTPASSVVVWSAEI
jgi:hypothetical protein